MDNQENRSNLTQLNLILTDGNCLNCRHCMLYPPPVRDGDVRQFMDSSVAVRAVEEALPLGLEAVRLSGNATLLYPHFDPLVSWLESLELDIHLETNGVGLTVQRADRLARLPLTTASIALNGADAETHDAAYHTPGAFTAATQAVRMLAEVGVATQVVVAVNRRITGQLEAIIRLAEKLGAVSVRFMMVESALYAHSPVENMVKSAGGNGAVGGAGGGAGGNGAGGSQRKNQSLEPGAMQIQELIALGRRIERELSNTTRLHLLVEQPLAFRGLYNGARNEASPRCGILNSIAVHPDGDYSLCSSGKTQPQLLLGKVGLDPLGLIWTNHALLRLLREGMPHRLEGICERCVMKTVCMGNCATENHYRTGSFWSANWFCAAADQVGLFPAGRLIENQR